MDNGNTTSFIEENPSNELIEASMKIEESINKLKSDFDRIGVNGDVWTGKVANISKETFDELVTKYYEFKNIDREYIDYLDRK